MKTCGRPMGGNPHGLARRTHPYLFGIEWSCLFLVMLVAGQALGQVNVLTAHNDIARTGQNLNETALTPSNVNPTQFGKLFSIPVDGSVYAQPLYVSQVAIPNKGTHNVVYVATTSDYVYAFDADSNGGIDANPLWQASLLTNSTPAGTYDYVYGVVGTPVIDASSNTMYVVSSESQNSVSVYRLHALDITTGVEKLGGPIQIQASVPGTGSGSSDGVLSFDPLISRQRPALLLLNGVLYTAFGSIDDSGPWHGWLVSYSAATLQQIDIFCTSANGIGSAIWMSGAGLAAEVNDPNKPYGRMFLATGNGAFAASQPYTNTMSYGMSVLDLDLTGGNITVEDDFTPYNEAALDGQDGDLGSGGPLILPTQTLASGTELIPLIQMGKSGAIYILDRNNLGGFSATGDQVVQEVQTPITEGLNWGAGVWGATAYWNGSIYSGGTNPYAGADNYAGYVGTGNSLTAYSFVNGVLSTTPTSQSVEQFIYPGPTPSISANGPTNGIVWALDNSGNSSGTPETLLAYDATNLANTLYSSKTNPSRDTATGTALKFTVPTIANGKVYLGATFAVNIYGLLPDISAAPAPVISPGSETITGSQSVTITDAVSGATIYYTTDGSTPTSSSAVYSSPLVISTNETITAIASPNGYLQSVPSSATYTSTSTTVDPVFSLSAGTYSGAQTLTLTASSAGAIIYYTLDGSTPTTASAAYSSALSIPVSETVRAIAEAPGLFASPVTSAAYTIAPVYSIDFTQGFTQAQGPMQFNGSTDLDDFRLQLTDGGQSEAGSAFYATPVNVQAFTTDFTFQLSNPAGNGITFTIQNVGPSALGSSGGGLGYATIPESVAIKFDLYNTGGEGGDSTGLYTDGAMPTVPAVNLTGTGIDLHSGDNIDAHITYDGTNLSLTLTDVLTLATWSTSWPINIPSVVGGNTAYVGFTGGTGTNTASQKLTYWTYIEGPLSVPNYPAGFDSVGMTLNGGAALNATRLRLTDEGANETRSSFFTVPVNIQQFSTSFDFQLTDATADGITFAIQSIRPTALGKNSADLGYGSIPKSVAVKFDLYNDEGEGPDSTGLYSNGATPTIPFTDLTYTGINLHSGDVFNAQLAYNGTVLTVLITDTVSGATATQSYTVDIPTTVGGPTANVGFTGSTNGEGAIQEILNWSYSTTYAALGPPPLTTIPEIINLNPNYGSYDATIELTGTNFGTSQGASTVTFSGAAATASAWSNTGITVTVPYHATTGNVVVTASGQSSNSVPFTVEPALSIIGISPTSGPVGTLVTISGQNLLDAQSNGQVWFGGVSTPILEQSATSLQVVIPAGATTGTFDIHINGVGVSTPTFAVIPTAAPSVTILTSPPGLQVNVGGLTENTPYIWTCTGGSISVTVPSPQSGGAGVQYVYSGWNDGTSQTRTIVCPDTNATPYTADFGTQYYLTTTAGLGGAVSPPSGWYNPGQTVAISASPNSGYSFGNWAGIGTGSYSGANQSAIASMDGPISENADFQLSPSFSLSASPVAVSIAQGGSGISTITLTEVGGFSSNVALSISGLPSGVTSSFTKGSPAETAVLTLTASNSATVTSAPATVTITGTSGTLTASTTIALTITALPSFAPGVGGTTSITITPGATTGNTGTISVSGTNGFSGTVNLSCMVTTALTNVSDMPTCGLNPTSMTISGTAAQPSTLTVTTTPASNAANQTRKPFGPLTSGITLALVALFAVPRRRRNWLATGLFLLFAAIGAIGCGSGSSGGGGNGGGNSGTTPGTYTITVTGSSGTISATVGAITLTVQ